MPSNVDGFLCCQILKKNKKLWLDWETTKHNNNKKSFLNGNDQHIVSRYGEKFVKFDPFFRQVTHSGRLQLNVVDSFAQVAHRFKPAVVNNLKPLIQEKNGGLQKLEEVVNVKKNLQWGEKND